MGPDRAFVDEREIMGNGGLEKSSSFSNWAEGSQVDNYGQWLVLICLPSIREEENTLSIESKNREALASQYIAFNTGAVTARSRWADTLGLSGALGIPQQCE